MDSIPENVPTERNLELDSILLIKDNDPTSQIQLPACAAPESDSAKATAISAASRGGHFRRNSTGNIGIPYKSVKILSRYLASTTASCHDQCKYGLRHDLDPNMPGSPTLQTIAEKHTKGYYYMGKKSGVDFPPSSPKSPKLGSPVSTWRDNSASSRKGNLFRQFSVPVPRSKPSLSKLSVLSAEDHSGSKEIGTYVQNINVLATSSNRKQIITNGKEKTTSKSNLHSVEKGLTRAVVSLSPKRVGKKHTSQMTDKLNSLEVVDKAEKTDKPSKNDISINQLSNNTGKTASLDQESKSMPKRGGIVREKDQESTARKLNFRRGKVTDNQTVIAPTRRLKLKKRSLSDSLVIDVEKMENNLKSIDIRVDDRETNAEDLEKVVLKRQEGDQDKKEAQNLLNNMIEETANKLAETKKSKVKVLVGAFETVISLQDTKPAASIVDDAC